MPTTENHIRHLQVLPSRSADLCFSMPGVIAKQNYNHAAKTGPAYLGQSVAQYDPSQALYPNFNQTISNPADPRWPGEVNARLNYDSTEIDEALTTSGAGIAPFLFALRNDSIAAALDQAIIRREALYFQRFKHGAATQTAMTTGFGKILPLLAQLEIDAANRFTAVDAKYAAQPPSKAVIESTTSEGTVSDDYLVSTSQRNAISVSDGFDEPHDKLLVSQVFEVTDPNPAGFAETLVQQHKSQRTTGFPFVLTPSSDSATPPTWDPVQEEFVEDSRTKTAGTQITTNFVPSLFHPRLDNTIAHKQLLSSIASETMNQTIASFSAPTTARIVKDDQDTTDLDVRRLQITFAETYLTSPIAGVVTAVFKEVGECVQAGEPVLRIENDAVVFLTGRIQYFGVLKIGQDVIVRAKDLYEAGVAKDFPGKVRGIRGHAADDDEWEVFVECDNPIGGDGKRLLPIYYQFDKDTTTVVVTT